VPALRLPGKDQLVLTPQDGGAVRILLQSGRAIGLQDHELAAAIAVSGFAAEPRVAFRKY